MEQKFWKPSEDVIKGKVEYKSPNIHAPLLSGLPLKAFIWLLEAPILGNLILSFFMRKNKFYQNFLESSIPEAPMFLPDYLEQNVENDVIQVEEEIEPSSRVAIALECLSVPSTSECKLDQHDPPFLYWKIRDYAKAYRDGWATPSQVAEKFIAAIEDSQRRRLQMTFFCSFSAEDVRKQASASTERHAKGKPLSTLDGILIAVKDDIDCLPHSSKGGTLWVHKVRTVREDAACIKRLRQCGAILVGKTNMHELGLGTTGSNPLLGTARNPHDSTRHTGGSSAGSAAIVSSGLCPAALGTDVGGSIRIPSAYCGVVGLKSTFGRTSLAGLQIRISIFQLFLQ
eukprot:c17869_g1_i2 orf=353-1378(+)